MSNKPDSKNQTIYQIKIGGRLDERWTVWFDGMVLSSEEGDTLLTGPVVDQAALHGLLRQVRDLGLPLISVIRLESGQTDEGKVGETPSI